MASSNQLRAIAGLCLLGACGYAHAIYKCTDAQGKTTYQQTPCESTAAQSSIGPEKRPPPSPAQKTAAAAPAAGARPPGVATLMTAVVRCSELSPAFAEKIQPSYKRWFDANTENVQAYQRSPDYGRVVTDARKERAASGGRMSPELTAECRKTEEYLTQNFGAPAK
jgi:hypothetical protein